jgi:hypothetical protein
MLFKNGNFDTVYISILFTKKYKNLWLHFIEVLIWQHFFYLFGNKCYIVYFYIQCLARSIPFGKVYSSDIGSDNFYYDFASEFSSFAIVLTLQVLRGNVPHEIYAIYEPMGIKEMFCLFCYW